MPPESATSERRSWLPEVGYLAGVYLVSLGYTLIMYWTGDQDIAADLRHRLDLLRGIDLVVGHVTFPLMLLRHRRPVLVALVLSGAMIFSSFASLVFLFSLVTLAAKRSRWAIVAALALIPLSSAIYTGTVQRWLRQEDAERVLSLGFTVETIYSVMLGLVFALLGWNIGARQALVHSHAAEARAQAAEHEAREAQARLAERARIARDMHDSLGHRLTLVSMHSAGMAYLAQGDGPDVPRAEVQRVAETCAGQSKAALEELREILGVLRSDSAASGHSLAAAPGQRAGGSTAGEPSTGMEGVERLVDELRSQGTRVTLYMPDTFCPVARERMPETISRHGYRVVQEALTNARKHAPGQEVSVWISGAPGEGLDIRVANPLEADGTRPARGVVSGGMGLVGMRERVDLAGGTLQTGARGREFVVEARLPWPASAT